MIHLQGIQNIQNITKSHISGFATVSLPPPLENVLQFIDGENFSFVDGNLLEIII